MTILCEIKNCPKRATFAYFYEQPERCKEDRVPQYRICICGLSRPSFNFKDEKRASSCKYCKKDGMIDIINKRCRCGKALPCFNFEGETERICCDKCKEKRNDQY
jgi:hypothetical protein